MTTYQIIMTILALTLSIAGLILTGLRILQNRVKKELKEENESHFKSIEKSIETLGIEVDRLKELKGN